MEISFSLYCLVCCRLKILDNVTMCIWSEEHDGDCCALEHNPRQANVKQKCGKPTHEVLSLLKKRNFTPLRGIKREKNVHGGIRKSMKTNFLKAIWNKEKNNKNNQSKSTQSKAEWSEREAEKKKFRSNEWKNKNKLSALWNSVSLPIHRVFAKYWFSECFAGCLLARLPCSLYIHGMYICMWEGERERGRKVSE